MLKKPHTKLKMKIIESTSRERHEENVNFFISRTGIHVFDLQFSNKEVKEDQFESMRYQSPGYKKYTTAIIYIKETEHDGL